MATKNSISRKQLEAKIVGEFDKAFKKNEILVPYSFEFRASRLPFCSREFVFYNRFPKDESPLRGETYNFRFYVSIGTAVHEVVQQFLGMASFLYGDWGCCGVIEHNREGSELCGVCGRPQKYEELAPNSILGMHVDGISLAYNAVVEFKTTSSKNIKTLKNPYDQHMTQASCYLAALNEDNDWDLDKIIFVYISRDNPSDFIVLVRKPIQEAYPETLKQFEDAKSDLANGVLPEKVCTTTGAGSWRGCPYVGVCFHPKVEEMLLPVTSLVRS